MEGNPFIRPYLLGVLALGRPPWISTIFSIPINSTGCFWLIGLPKKTCRKATNQTKEDSYWKSFFLAQSWILLNSDHRFPKQRWWFHRHILGKIHAVWPIFQIDGLFSPPRNNINNQHHRSQHLLGVFGGGNYLQFTQLTLGSASPRFGPVRVMLGSNEGNVLCDVS